MLERISDGTQPGQGDRVADAGPGVGGQVTGGSGVVIAERGTTGAAGEREAPGGSLTGSYDTSTNPTSDNSTVLKTWRISRRPVSPSL